MILYRSCQKSNDAISHTVTINGLLQKSSLDSVFKDNTEINTDVIIGNNVCSCRNTFSGCTNFDRNIQIPDSVTNCSYMFANCTNLNQNILIPSTTTDCSRMFSGCTNLDQNIKIPDVASNCSYMFQNCFLMNQDIKISYVGNIRAMFLNCRLYNQAFILPSTTIGTDVCIEALFSDCVIFNKPITISESLGVNSLYQLFLRCSRFNCDVTVPSTVEDIRAMLHTCDSFGRNVYVKGTTSRPLNTFGMLTNTNVSKRKNIHFNAALNSAFNSTSTYTIIGSSSISWTRMTNGFYNTQYNIYCYNNYS